jgi:hypothetical protein
MMFSNEEWPELQKARRRVPKATPILSYWTENG